MRTFDQLSKKEQAEAEIIALNEILQAVVEGGLRFSDSVNKDNFQASIDRAMEEANRMRTPWFVGNYIMQARFDSELLGPDQSVGEQLRGMARADAEDAVYPDKGERIISLG